MQADNFLGIYLSKHSATVVCLGPKGKDAKLLGCFTVTIDPPDQPTVHQLADLIAKGCNERKWTFAETTVALDCSMFMQHSVHSEFTDQKQISSTIRFDAEEALASDVADIAIAFKITSTDEKGSAITVFTAEHKILSEIISALQTNNIDPAAIEPDINSLARFVCQNISIPADRRTMFGILARQSGYFIIPLSPEPQKAFPTAPIAMRTFLIGPKQNRTDLLASQVPMTTAAIQTTEPIDSVKLFDSAGSLTAEDVHNALAIDADLITLSESVGIELDVLADTDQADFAIAYGAALANLEKAQTMNFRADFMPYLGKKVRLQTTMKFLSAAIIILILALGLRFQVQLFQRNKLRAAMREKFADDYLSVMLAKKKLPTTFKQAAAQLNKELRRTKSIKSGLIGAEGQRSIAAKLTLVLEAFNNAAAQTDLNIDKIAITSRNIRIVGTTANRQSTLKLFEETKKVLEISTFGHEEKGGRDNFKMTVIPKTQ